MAISTSVADAFRLFAGLEEQPVWNELPQLSTSKLFLIEELGRFRIWSGNIGAHKSGRSSLDYRLRDNTRLERTVLQLLDDLKTSLEDVLSIASGADEFSNSDNDILEDDEDGCVSGAETVETGTSVASMDARSDDPFTQPLLSLQTGDFDFDCVELSQSRQSTPKALSFTPDILQLRGHKASSVQKDSIASQGEGFSAATIISPSLDTTAQRSSIFESEIQQLHRDIAEIITCLFRFSMTIRNPSSHTKFARAEKVDKSAFEPFDISHVRNKFPLCEEYLVLRLGKAITKRRRYLAYLKDHQQRLESGLVDTVGDRDDAQTQAQPLSTVASSLPEAFRNSLDSEAEIDRGSDAGRSETSYASSSDEHTKLCPPPLPSEAMSGVPYKCPVCYAIIDIHTTLAWRKHVFRDLHPYICTFKDCIMPDRLFTSRNEWFSHELQLHRRSWLCLQGCLQTFRDTGDFVSHVRNSHRHMFIEDQLPSLIDMSESTAPMDEEVTCSVCNEQVPHLKQLRRHLGRHQEQLALFALPLSVNEDENKRDDLKDSDYGSDNTVPVPEPDFLRQTLTHTPEAQDNAQNNEDGGYNRALLQEALEWLDVTEDQPDDFVIERYIKKVSPKERRTMKVKDSREHGAVTINAVRIIAEYRNSQKLRDLIDLLDPSFLPAQPVNSGPEETGSGTLSSLSDAKAPDQADNEANPLPRTTVGEWKAGASSTSPEDGSWEDPASSAGDDLGRPFEGIENSNNPFFTMQDANAWDKTPNISSYTDGLIRKKNARFHIPPERNLNNIDELISLAQDEEEKKELKQQKRLLRNRRAALESRMRRKKFEEGAVDDKQRMKDMEEELERLRKELEEHEMKDREMDERERQVHEREERMREGRVREERVREHEVRRTGT